MRGRIALEQGGNLVLGLGEPLIAPLVAQPVRDDVMLLWALDRRLAELARSGKEPALRQIRLRWWRERLAELAPGAAPAEPLLALVAERLIGRIGGEELAGLADAWEAEAVGDVDPSGERGVRLFALTARLLGRGEADVTAAGRLWALVEHLSTSLETNGDEWYALALSAHFQRSRDAGGLPRPLAVLTALARSIALRGGRRSRWREQLLVLRVGLFGR